MEKTIKIGEKEITLKANAMNALVFRANFGSDIFSEEAKIVTLAKDERYSDMEILKIMQIVWTMAKCADKKTLPFEQWLEDFEEFPLIDILSEIIDLILQNFSTKTTIKNLEAAAKK